MAHLQTNGKLRAFTFSKSNLYHLVKSQEPSMVITMSNNSQSHWTSINANIEAHIRQAIPIRPPLVVFEPMHHLALSAPKSMAPALCIAVCELLGGHHDQAMAAASALYLINSASFVHEHMSLTDRPNKKSKPTIPREFRPYIELLTGDGLVPFGFELMSTASAQIPNGENCDKTLRVMIEIARASGSQGMVGGQYIKSISCDQSEGDELCHVIKKVEGELHACAAACGAIMGGGSEDEIEKMRNFGLHVGMIQGMLSYGFGREKERLMQRVEEYRKLALKELEDFDHAKVVLISSFLEQKDH